MYYSRSTSFLSNGCSTPISIPTCNQNNICNSITDFVLFNVFWWGFFWGGVASLGEGCKYSSYQYLKNKLDTCSSKHRCHKKYNNQVTLITDDISRWVKFRLHGNKNWLCLQVSWYNHANYFLSIMQIIFYLFLITCKSNNLF